MKNETKHAIISGSITAVIVGIVFYFGYQPEKFNGSILALKVPKADILYNQEYTEYEYDAEGKVLSQKQIVSYAYKSGELAPALKDEIIEKRTPHIVYRNLGGNKRSAQSGYNFYRENGDWKKLKFATTTSEGFNKEMSK